MVRISRSLVLVGAICTLLGVTAASAQTAAPVTGLGQSWPNATDVSASLHYHVYAFNRDGIRYFQINDLNGNVLAAFATVGREVLVLPMGANAGSVNVLSQPSASTATGNGAEKLYSDKSITVTATPVVTSQGGAQPELCSDLDCTIINVAPSVPQSNTPASGQCDDLNCTIINVAPTN
jgi:hypothetical protein